MLGVTDEEATGVTVLLPIPTPAGNILGVVGGAVAARGGGLGRTPISGVIVRGADVGGVVGNVTAGGEVGEATSGREITGGDVVVPDGGKVTLPGAVMPGSSIFVSGAGFAAGVIGAFGSIPGKEGTTAMLGGAVTAAVGVIAVGSGKLVVTTGNCNGVATGGVGGGDVGDGRDTADGKETAGGVLGGEVVGVVGEGMGI